MIACVFLGLTLYPFGMRFPSKNLQSLDLKTSLSALKVMLFGLQVCSSVMMLASCGTSAGLWIKTSSAMLRVLGMLLRTWSSLSLKTPPASLSSNGDHSHQNLHHDVLKVVIRLLSSSNGTCQNPDLASKWLKYLELGSSGRLLLTALLYHWFHCMGLLRSFGSRHNFSEPLGFFIGTMELIHSLYCFTSAMMPKFCILSSTAL